MDARLCNTQRNRKHVQRAILQYFSDYCLLQRNSELDTCRDQKFQCRMDVRYFPFDTQTCAMSFESWKYTVDQVVMFPEGNIKVPEYEHEIWDIVAASAAQQESLYYTGNFSSVSFSFKLKRKSMYFVIYLVAPTVMLAILTFFYSYYHHLLGKKCH